MSEPVQDERITIEDGRVDCFLHVSPTCSRRVLAHEAHYCEKTGFPRMFMCGACRDHVDNKPNLLQTKYDEAVLSSHGVHTPWVIESAR